MTFSNFTEKARQSISNAHDVACEMGHYYIGSEHLLLGLIKEGTGVAAKALSEQGVTAEKVTEKLKEMVGIKPSISTDTELALTPRSKRILEFSAMEAKRLGHNYIGTEHILMAIIRDGDGVAAQILIRLGVNLQTFYSNTSTSIDSVNNIPFDKEKVTNMQYILKDYSTDNNYVANWGGMLQKETK